MSSDMMSEESSVREGAGYNEAFGLGDESEDFSHSSGRETSAQSLDGEDKGYAKESKEVGVEVGQEGSLGDGGDDHDAEDGDGDKEDDGEESCEGALVGLGDNCPFIVLAKWAINKFLPLMSDKIFKELHVRYQIPEHEKCYTGRTADVGMYDSMFTAGLRLPLMALHC